MSIVVSIIAAALVLGILVTIHEGGHFFVGKALGFKINEFAIGMGPKLFSREKNGTVYSLRAFPIGGMCAFEGEDEESESDQSFNSFPAWKRLLVALAGPLTNIIFAFIAAIILLAIFGQNQIIDANHPMIAGFSSETAPAKAAGMQEADMVIAVNGESVSTTDEMIAKIKADEDGDITLTVLRGGEGSYYAINGIEVTEDTDIAQLVKENKADGYSVTLENAAELDITIKDAYNEEAKSNIIGASVTTSAYSYEEKYNIITAIPAGCGYVADVTKQMYSFLGTLFTGKAKVEDMSGIVGIVDVVNDGVSTVMEEESFSTGAKVSYIVEFIFYLGVLLSLNLGIINLLPLPALDGGRIVFNIIDIISPKPVPAKIEGWIHTIGLILLFGLIIVITIKDVIFLFR